MPYPIAHPAAAVPLGRLLGRHAVPSALAIGCVVPDLWYVVPLLDREQTHGLAGLVWFCLPASLALYAGFHLLAKRPLIALLPRALAVRAAAYASPGLPRASWLAVASSALAGAASHLLWDALTHGPGDLSRLLQHASTLGGTAFLACWVAARLRAASPQCRAERLPQAWRWAVLGTLITLTMLAGLESALEHLPLARADFAALRALVRASAASALQALLSALLGYCVLWTLVSARGDVARDQHG
jgi:hypothetical protein